MFSIITDSHYGLIAGIIGCVLGCIGGAVGTYLRIKNTRGPLQRKFMIKAAAVSWIMVTLFLGLLIGLPFPYGFIMWVPYGLFLPLGGNYAHLRLHQLRMIEENTKPSMQKFTPAPLSPGLSAMNLPNGKNRSMLSDN
jgi:hypothetical protein